MLDVALTRNPSTGKHDLTFDDFGDVVFDDLAVYPVLTTIVSHKGRYYWDTSGEQGTYLHTVRRDAYATGSQIRAYCQDGLDQVVAVGAIASGTAASERTASRQWVGRPRWYVPGRDKQISREVRT